MQKRDRHQINKDLMGKFGIKNSLAVPKIEKVVLNMGIGEVAKNDQTLEKLKNDLASIAGQMPSIRKSRISIASFSLRAGMPVGLSATLRGERMYSFLNRLFSIVLPRLRDFRGVPAKSFDKMGNYTLGFVEHTVFPEVDASKSAPAHGMEVTIVTSTKDAEKARALLKATGCPFEKE